MIELFLLMAKKITTWDEIRPSLQGTANHGVTVVVERDGQSVENYSNT